MLNDSKTKKNPFQFGDQSNSELRTIIESVPHGIIMVNSLGRIILSNMEAEKMFGYGHGELLDRELEILVPSRFRAKHPAYRAGFVQHPSKRQMGAGRDLAGLRKDGTEIPVEIGLNHIQKSDEMYVIASIVDITERKAIEDKLHRAYDEVQQKSLEMEQFVYTVSHDLKAPLVTSMSFLGFLREDLAENRMDDVMDSLERLERAHMRMQELINDLLQLSRVGRMELQLEMFTLDEVFDEIADFVEENVKSKHVTVEIAKPLPVIHADRSRVHQVLENLLSNAFKYGTNSESGGRVKVFARETDDETQVCVKDFGPGIEKQYHKKIFGLFQRLHNDREGTGVGLAIVARIMQMHGGRVWIESEPGQGAEFWVAFPKESTLE